jgi:hypothetical protein
MAREASILLFSPRIMAMDAYPVTQLPHETIVVFVAATAGQVGLHAGLAVPSRSDLWPCPISHLPSSLCLNQDSYIYRALYDHAPTQPTLWLREKQSTLSSLAAGCLLSPEWQEDPLTHKGFWVADVLRKQPSLMSPL